MPRWQPGSGSGSKRAAARVDHAALGALAHDPGGDQRLAVAALAAGDAEALDLLLAMNSGIPAAGTIHAKSASAALEKLKLLPMLAQANIDAGFMAATVASVIDFVIHVENRDGKRGIAQILQVHR